MELLWLFAVAGGPLIIGVLIAFALLRRRGREEGPAVRRARNEAVERMYGEEPDEALRRR
jgi:hypothetical protein